MVQTLVHECREMQIYISLYICQLAATNELVVVED